MLFLQSLVVVGNVQAAGANQKKTVLKQQQSQSVAAKKITHPCARKSAAQLNQRAKPFIKSINAHARTYGVDSDLVKSVITIESCYRKKARSPKGAQGLMQLIPATAERFGIKNAYDSHQNIKGGSRYLAWLSKRFRGDLTKVLAAYNAGEGKVDRYNGVPPYRETQNYVHDVLVVYNKFKQQKQVTPSELLAKLSAQKKIARTPQQKRQIEARKQQLLRQANLRRQQQQQRLAQLRRQQPGKPGMVIVTGKPGKPLHVPRPVPQIVIGKPPISAAAQKRLAAKKASNRPVPRKAGARISQQQPANFLQQRVQKAPQGRVRNVFKPGRGGWMANKALAPHLFKQ
ncbi:MAG: lytic transglycosylase domain-containing protein [Thiolinea sp.]